MKGTKKSGHTVFVASRVHKRHPNIKDDDVIHAMKSMIKHKKRKSGEWIAIGGDSKGRTIEMVYLYDILSNVFYVYHAQVPPTTKTLKELGLQKRKRGRK